MTAVKNSGEGKKISNSQPWPINHSFFPRDYSEMNVNFLKPLDQTKKRENEEEGMSKKRFECLHLKFDESKILWIH